MAIDALPPKIERELGHGGTGALGSVNRWSLAAAMDVDDPEEEPALAWPESIRVFNKMRRTDAQVAATLKFVTLPILRTPKRLDPNGAPDEVVRMVADDLDLPVIGMDPTTTGRKRDRWTFAQHLPLAMLSLTFGHMFFEQVYRIVDGRARIRKLAPRLPSTIAAINVAPDGGLIGIEQRPWMDPSKPNATIKNIPIPVERLVAYVTDREGANWYGTSILRSAYKHWMLKDRLYRVQAMTIERNGMGVPVVEGTQPGATPAQEAQAAQLASAYRAGDGAGGHVPYGFRLRLVGVEGTLPDPLPAIQHHDESIARNVLAQFLMLGQTQSGSRALGDSFMDAFMLAEQAVMEQVIETANRYIIEDLVDLNFGPDVPAPRIVATEIGAEQSVTAEALEGLIRVGGITPDPELENWLRRAYRMPLKSESPDPAPNVPTVVPAPPAIAASEGSAFWRQPTAIELAARTDFAAMNTAWQTSVDDVVAKWKTMRAGQVDELVEAITAAVDAGDLEALGKLTATTGSGAALLTEAMEAVAEAARDAAIAEATAQGLTPATPDDVLVFGTLPSRAAATDALLASSLSETAGRHALRLAADGADGASVAASVRDHVDGLNDQWLVDQLGGAITAAQNNARSAVFRENRPTRIYASELLDKATCANCSAIDGTEYASLSDAEAAYPTGGYADCLGGPRCRGTLVAVWDESPATK